MLDNICDARDRKIESGSHDVKCVLKDEIFAAEPLPKVHLAPQCADLWNCLSTELGIEVFALQPPPDPCDQQLINACKYAAVHERFRRQFAERSGSTEGFIGKL